MRRLKKLDKVAYVRFASVYLDFKDVKEFMSELKGLLKRPLQEVTSAARSGGCQTPAVNVLNRS